MSSANSSSKKLLKRIWPILFIVAIWFIFAYPYFLKGKVPYPSAFQVNHYAPWSSYEQFWGPVKNAAMPDIITQIYPWRHFAIEMWKSGEFPLWNPYSFSGDPHLANYQSAVLFPGNILFLIFSFVDAWSLLILVQPLLAGLFMYWFVRSLRISVTGSLIAGVSFMFCGFITAWMGYATLAYAILFLPLSLFSIEKYLATQKFRFLFLLSITMPLSFFSGHFQTSLYFLLFILAYILFKLFVTRDKRAFLYFVLAVLFGLFLSMSQIIPSIEFYTQSARSTSFQAVEVIPWSYLPTLLAPDFYGNPVTRNDWFGHYAEWNAYIGVLPLIFALYAILRRKNHQTIFLLTMGILSLVFAFNSPLVDLLVKLKIPVLGTSAVSRVIVLFSFSMAVLSAFGFDWLFADISKKKVRPIIAWGVVSLTLFLTLWIIAGLGLLDLADPTKIVVARRNLILPTALFIAGSFLILFIALAKRKQFLIPYPACRQAGLLFLLLLVSFDMLRFAIKWMPFDPKHFVFPQTPITSFYSKTSGVDRVFGNFTAENSVYYRLSAVEGYDPLYIGRYGEFASALQDGVIRGSGRSTVGFPRDSVYMPKVINFLGIKYFIHKISDGKASWAFPYWRYPEGQFKLLFDDGKFQVLENTKVFPRVFLVGKYQLIRDKQRIIDTMFSQDFDLKREVVLEEDPKIRQVEGGVGGAKIIEYIPNKIRIETNSNTPALLSLSDNFYPGWKATVEGIPTQIYRADYTFRAVVVPEGKHIVQFIYDPFSFKLGVYLAIIGIIGMFSIGLLSRGVKAVTPRR